MEFQCPDCEASLVKTAKDKFRCESCKTGFNMIISCNKCSDELEVLEGCGAVNFWCHKCNELKSKKSAIYTLTKI